MSAKMERPYFIASGSIVNPTSTAQTVPEMLVTLKDAGGRPVYSWKMKAKVRTFAPGAKVDFSEARLGCATGGIADQRWLGNLTGLQRLPRIVNITNRVAHFGQFLFVIALWPRRSDPFDMRHKPALMSMRGRHLRQNQYCLRVRQ